MSNTTISLQERYKQLKEEKPKLRAYQAAKELGVSEAELLASQCDGEKVVRLQGSWVDLIKQIETLGYVMALTRNESAVHEKKGYYKNFEFYSHAGVVHNGNIDLRIFQRHFEFGFATSVRNPRGTLYSLQFFEPGGDAIHKVYMMNEEHMDAYYQLIEDFKHPDQSPSIVVTKSADPEPLKDSEIDVEALLAEWKQLKSTHDFYPMLRNYKVARMQSLRLGDGTFTRKVSNKSTDQLLHLAVENKVPIMAFVGSRGVVQIHSGEINKVVTMDNWLNIMDPEFNLHLQEDTIAHSWIVEKPSEDGMITSLEIFDADENLIANFFGERKPGIPELETWRELVNQLN